MPAWESPRDTGSADPRYFPTVRKVLKLPAFRRLLGAYALNELAWAFGTLALAFLVYRRTHSAVGAMAFFLCSQFVPALVSPLVVARLDQRPVRTVLPALYVLEGLAFLALAWLARHFALAPVLLIATIDGVIALAARSLARAATVAVTADAGLLRQGNALANATWPICFMAGPVIAGGVVVAGGTSTAMLVNSGLFALIALTLVTAAGLPGATANRAPVAGRVRAALAHARRRRAIRALLGLQAIALVFFTVSIPVEVVFAQHSLHTGAGGYGALLSAWGAGAVAGSAVYARWLSLPARTLIALGSGALGAGFVIMAVAPSLAVAIAGAAVAGAGNGIETVSARTALQEQTEQPWMVMMMSLNESIAELMPGAGILLGGAIASLAGPRPALAVGGGGALAVTAAVWVVLRPGASVSDASTAAQATAYVADPGRGWARFPPDADDSERSAAGARR
jgi:hypothetical protein